MNVIETHVNPADSAFKINRERMQQLVADLRERVSRAHQGGGPKYIERHREPLMLGAAVVGFAFGVRMLRRRRRS